MCGRFALAVTPEALRIFIGLVRLFTFDPRYNVAPTQRAVAVRAGPDGRFADVLRWGLVPFWSPDPLPKIPLINARCEGIFEKPSFRGPIHRRRCIIPASGFYEWDRGAPKGSGAFLFRPRSHDPVALAGIWDRWEARGLHPAVESFAILTTTANATLQPYHDRMPVILPAEAWDAWLDPACTDRRQVESRLRPAPDDLLEAVPVGTRVNRVANDDPSCWIADPGITP